MRGVSIDLTLKILRKLFCMFRSVNIHVNTMCQWLPLDQTPRVYWRAWSPWFETAQTRQLQLLVPGGHNLWLDHPNNPSWTVFFVVFPKSKTSWIFIKRFRTKYTKKQSKNTNLWGWLVLFASNKFDPRFLGWNEAIGIGLKHREVPRAPHSNRSSPHFWVAIYDSGTKNGPI